MLNLARRDAGDAGHRPRPMSMRFLRSSALAAAIATAGAAAMLPAAPAHAYVSFGISVYYAPPPLPIYAQPPCPGPDFIWIPGFWAWDEDYDDYYWVPGTWVLAPEPGFLWTPAWWGWSDGVYIFHAGYWGPHVGFYGGIDYGFGYNGFGYDGGYWRDDHFFYNRAVNNITNISVTNVYYRPVIQNNYYTTASFNGPGGATARPTSAQLIVMREPHLAPTPLQTRMIRAAARQEDLHAAVNHGVPIVAASEHPGQFRGQGVTAATGARGFYRGPAGDQGRHAGPLGGPSQPRGLGERDRLGPTERGTPRFTEPGGPGPSQEVLGRRVAGPAASGRAFGERGFTAERRGPSPTSAVERFGPDGPPSFSRERRGIAGPPPGPRGPEDFFVQDRRGRTGPVRVQEGPGPAGRDIFSPPPRGRMPTFGQDGPPPGGHSAFMPPPGRQGQPGGSGFAPRPDRIEAARPPRGEPPPRARRGDDKSRGPQD